VDPFVAAYCANGSDTAFVVRGADASLPDNEYRVAVHKPFEGYNAVFTAQAGGGGLTGTAGGDSLSVNITPDTMAGTIQAADGPIYHLNLTHNCAQ